MSLHIFSKIENLKLLIKHCEIFKKEKQTIPVLIENNLSCYLKTLNLNTDKILMNDNI